jgi:hypothetical protein
MPAAGTVLGYWQARFSEIPRATRRCFVARTQRERSPATLMDHIWTRIV